jgi:hypothetical protein
MKRRRWKAGRQHSWSIVPWNRSTTALWFGERAGIRTWVMDLVASAARKLVATY